MTEEKTITVIPPAEMNTPYGRVSIIKELGKGVSLIISTAALSTVIITKEIANKFLSVSARLRGDELGNGSLGYPSSDGRIHIPLYELSEKNYISQSVSQIRSHFNHLCNLIPEYLRERGFVKPKPIRTIADKIEEEYDEWYKEIKSYSKKELVSIAGEIDKYNLMRKYFTKSDFPIEKQGILLSVPYLLDYTYDYLSNNNLDFTDENLDELCDKWRNNMSEMLNEEDYLTMKKSIDVETDSFIAELQTARKNYVNSISLRLVTSEGEHNFVINKIDFDNLLLTEDLRQDFAQKAMPGYPEPDYYGEHNRRIFDALFIKRFESDIVENWNNFAPQGGNGVRLEITALSTSVVPANAYDELVSRSLIKKYLENNYKNPERFYDKITDLGKESNELIDSIKNLKEDMKSLAPEKPDKEIVEKDYSEAAVEKAEKSAVNPELASQDLQATGTDVTENNLEKIIKAAKNDNPVYISSSDDNSSYIKIENKNDTYTVRAYIGSQEVSSTNDISTVPNIVKGMEKPTAYSSADFAKVVSAAAIVNQTVQSASQSRPQSLSQPEPREVTPKNIDTLLGSVKQSETVYVVNSANPDQYVTVTSERNGIKAAANIESSEVKNMSTEAVKTMVKEFDKPLMLTEEQFRSFQSSAEAAAKPGDGMFEISEIEEIEAAEIEAALMSEDIEIF